MTKEPRGPQAARLRQRKFQLLHRFFIPPDLLPGTLTRSFTRCGNPRCHCAHDKGHESWTLTFMAQGQRRAEREVIRGIGARPRGREADEQRRGDDHRRRGYRRELPHRVPLSFHHASTRVSAA